MGHPWRHIRDTSNAGLLDQMCERLWLGTADFEVDEAKTLAMFLMENKYLQVALTTNPDEHNEAEFPEGLATNLDIDGRDKPLSRFVTNEARDVLGQDRQAAKFPNEAFCWYNNKNCAVPPIVHPFRLTCTLGLSHLGS